MGETKCISAVLKTGFLPFHVRAALIPKYNPFDLFHDRHSHFAPTALILVHLGLLKYGLPSGLLLQDENTPLPGYRGQHNNAKLVTSLLNRQKSTDAVIFSGGCETIKLRNFRKVRFYFPPLLDPFPG